MAFTPASLLAVQFLPGGVENLPAVLADERVEVPHRPGGGVHGEVEALAHHPVAFHLHELLADAADVLPRARVILVRIETRLLEVLPVDVEAEDRRDGRNGVELPVVDVAVQRARQVGLLHVLEILVAQPLGADGPEHVLRGEAWQERVDDREHVGRRPGGERRRELLEVRRHREELVPKGGVGVRLVPLLHQLLRVVVVRRIAVLPPGEWRLRRTRPAEKQNGQTDQELSREESSHGSPSFDVLPVGSTKLHRDSRKPGNPHCATSGLVGRGMRSPEDSRDTGCRR